MPNSDLQSPVCQEEVPLGAFLGGIPAFLPAFLRQECAGMRRNAAQECRQECPQV
jgi:hypothetical protein